MRTIRLSGLSVVVGSLCVSITAVSAQTADPVTVIQHYYEARNRGDVSEAMTAIAPDATYQSGVCVPQCVGSAEIQKREVEGGIRGGNQYTVLDATLSGMTVTLRVQIRNNLARRAGVDRFLIDVTANVPDGKIAAYRAVPDASDSETAAYLAFQSSQAAGQPTQPQIPTALPRTGELAPRLPVGELGGGMLLLVAGLLLRALSRVAEARSSKATSWSKSTAPRRTATHTSSGITRPWLRYGTAHRRGAGREHRLA